MDTLYNMFKLQKNFQTKILKSDLYSIDFLRIMALGSIIEISEAVQETNWKPWKKNIPMNNIKFKYEIVDCLCFIINMCLSQKITSKELYLAFIEKNKINITRQKNDY